MEDKGKEKFKELEDEEIKEKEVPGAEGSIRMPHLDKPKGILK